MISTQRLILIMAVIYLMIGLINYNYDKPDVFSNTPLDNELQQGEQQGNDLFGEEGKTGNVKQTNPQYETTFGNAIKLAKFSWDLVFKVFFPFSIDETQFSNPIEQSLVILIEYFRLLCIFLIGIELWNWKKGKTT